MFTHCTVNNYETIYIYIFFFKYENFLGVTCFLSFDGTWSMLCKEYKNFTRITESALLTLTTKYDWQVPTPFSKSQ